MMKSAKLPQTVKTLSDGEEFDSLCYVPVCLMTYKNGYPLMVGFPVTPVFHLV